VDIKLPKGAKISIQLVHKVMRMKHMVWVLWIIGRGNGHGYGIMKDLNAMGIHHMGASRIYPLLSSMAKEGLVSKARKGRKVCYMLTKKGARCLGMAKEFMSHGLRGEFMREMAGCSQ
jgi:DNA-binding PadR family transcriptional regulator